MPSLYLVGIPGKIGGASTKLVHLVRLLRRDFKVTVIAPDICVARDKEVRRILEPYAVPCVLLKDLPKNLEGTALGMCDRDFFASGRARDLKDRGARVVWSNEMMFPFKGEPEAAREGTIDRVLFVSELQAAAFAEIYHHVPSCLTGNYIDPDDYCWRQRANAVFTLGRLSREDPHKYPWIFRCSTKRWASKKCAIV